MYLIYEQHSYTIKYGYATLVFLITPQTVAQSQITIQNSIDLIANFREALGIISYVVVLGFR